jgi:hypothetical protein
MPPPPNGIGKRRRSAVLRTHAPGAVVDMRAECFSHGPVSGVCAGLETWVVPGHQVPMDQRIVERRLCRKLGKRYFLLPPLPGEAAGPGANRIDALRIVRFPRWLQCPRCNHVRQEPAWGHDPGSADRFCAPCSNAELGQHRVTVVPVRFAAACTSGHIEEFPWNWWVHRQAGVRCDSQVFVIENRGTGLAGLFIVCGRCKCAASMDGAFGQNALAPMKCRGLRPWLQAGDSRCDCSGADGNFRVVQRGAANIYYPVVESSLDIPPWTRALQAALGHLYADVENVDAAQRVMYIGVHPPLVQVCRQFNLQPQQLADAFAAMQEQLNGAAQEANMDLRADEFRVLSTTLGDSDAEFKTHVELVPDLLQPFIKRVLRISRLREVRAIRGFTRITPPEGARGSMAPLSMAPQDWLPGLEVRGEGIFIQLDEDKVCTWEQEANVLERTQDVAHRWDIHMQGLDPDTCPVSVVGPRLLMIHAFAHALMRQLTLECGYSSASLQERLYVWRRTDKAPLREPMAGVLIYTASPDSDGTLGGLQRRGHPTLLEHTVIGALKSMSWCSSDPLCSSGRLASEQSYSIGACHNCMLVPETACEHFNRYLDRALLVGTDGDRALGFFAGLI